MTGLQVREFIPASEAKFQPHRFVSANEHWRGMTNIDRWMNIGIKAIQIHGRLRINPVEERDTHPTDCEAKNQPETDSARLEE
jgi:hypothetical protein